MLISFAGLPGLGKCTLAKALAEATGAVFLHIDAIEQAIVGSGLIAGSVDESGYREGASLAGLRAAMDQISTGRLENT